MDMSRGASVSCASLRLFPTLPPLEKLIVRVAAGVMSCVCVCVCVCDVHSEGVSGPEREP